MIKRKFIIHLLILALFSFTDCFSNNVIIVVIDGARYSETFGAEDIYIPNIWNKMRPNGTIFTNFYNDGLTKTNPGHAAISTGKWQNIANDGSERPEYPTIYEYYRSQNMVTDSSAFIVAGANKISALSFSNHTEYGSNYSASSITNNYTGDLITFNNLNSVLDNHHPELTLINFKQVDKIAHAGNWQDYLSAIIQVDSLIYQLWLKINNDEFYKDNTTLFITNDHGRHLDSLGGFKNHGDSCEGCRHIMFLAIGKDVISNQIITQKFSQIDIAPTVGELLSFDAEYADGISFANNLKSLENILLISDESDPKSFNLNQNYPNPFNSSTIIKFIMPYKEYASMKIFDINGKEVATLVNNYLTKGSHDILWNANNFPSGTYFYTLQIGNSIECKKMQIIK